MSSVFNSARSRIWLIGTAVGATQKFLRRYTGIGVDYPVLTGLFGPRGRPYSEGHVVVGHDKLPQTMTKHTAELFLAVLTVLGSHFEDFFNGVAPGKPKANQPPKLHAQFLKRVVPIFDVAHIKDWPVLALRETLSTISEAGDWIKARVDEFAPLMKCDFLFRHYVAENTSAYTIVCIPRAENQIKPEILAGEDFGAFGALEVAGYFLSVRTEQGYRRLQGNPRLYEQARRQLRADEVSDRTIRP